MLGIEKVNSFRKKKIFSHVSRDNIMKTVDNTAFIDFEGFRKSIYKNLKYHQKRGCISKCILFDLTCYQTRLE